MTKSGLWVVFIGIGLAVFAMSACDTYYTDYPVEFDLTDEAMTYGEDSFVLPGIYEEQLFGEIENGGDIYVIHGFQGGTWVHLSVRINAMPSSGEISAELVGDQNGAVGSISYAIQLVRSAEGYLEAYDIPIPIPEDTNFLNALYGQAGILKVRYVSGEYSVEATRAIVFREG